MARIKDNMIAIAVAAFMVIMSVNIYKETLGADNTPPPRQRSGTISVWHVVENKPYTGSVSTIIAQAAREIERAEYGTYFNVEGITEQEYNKRIERGQSADIISFPAGLIDENGLGELDAADHAIAPQLIKAGSSGGKLYAIAYAQSPCVLIENKELAQKAAIALDEGEISAEALMTALRNTDTAQGILSGRAERWALLGAQGQCAEAADFKEGRAALCIEDIRLAKELSLLNERGKGFAYAVHGITGQHGNIQLIAISNSVDAWAKQRGQRLISLLLSPKYAAKIAACGLYPAGEYDGDELISPVNAAELLKDAPCTNAFLLSRYADAIADEAARALTGDISAAAVIAKRYGELFD